MVPRQARGSEPRQVIIGSGRGRPCWSGGRLEGDLVADGFELGDQALGFPAVVKAAGEEVSAELVVGRASGRDVPDDHEHRVRLQPLRDSFPVPHAE